MSARGNGGVIPTREVRPIEKSIRKFKGVLLKGVGYTRYNTLTSTTCKVFFRYLTKNSLFKTVSPNFLKLYLQAFNQPKHLN